MWKPSLSILFLVVAPVFGQLDPHTITISATRSTYLQPDDAVFSVSASAGAATSLDQVVAALSSLGITSSDLTGVNNTYAPPNLQWNFNLAVPLSSLTATIGSLTKLQQTITQNNSGLTSTFSVNGTQVSQQLQQSQSCSNSELIADATAQAQKLAAAAGLTLGSIAKLSNGSLPQTYAVLYDPLVGYIVPNNFVLASSPVTCSLVVEFRLLP
ncbi:MAG: SIMPL domain-containing protein [Bryobacteraceae bacterium]